MSSGSGFVEKVRQERDNSATNRIVTLLELCAGLGIISTAVMFSAPSLMRARENYELDAVVRQVSGRMQAARLKAISRNRDCRIVVPSETSYAVECEAPEWRPEEVVVLPQGFRIAANSTPTFHKRGNVSPTGTVTVRNRRMKSKRVIVNITGRVRVE